jgi:hypothetical protein
MSDDWEDWDCENFVIPVLNIQSLEQSNKLKERKLVEEADNELARQLFKNNDEDDEDLVLKELKEKQKLNNIKIIAKEKPKNKISKQKENELKQKEISNKLREQKIKNQRFNELYGEVIDDEYYEYEEKFYN